MELVLSFMTISATGSLLWLCLLCIRPITKKLFSQTWHYYASLIPLFFLLGGSCLINPIVEAMYTILQSKGVSVITDDYSLITVAEQAAENTAFINVFVNDAANNLDLHIITPYLVAIWAMGLLVFFALNLTRYYQFKLTVLKFSTIVDKSESPVKVVKSSMVITPMLLGVLKPVIVLPDFELTHKELVIVLSHELIHKKRGDLIIKLFVLIANGIHWFNPMVYYLNKDMDFLCECSCDEKLVVNLDKEDRRFYGETIISMLEYGVAQKNGLYTSFCGSKKNIKRRLTSMMDFKRIKKSLTALSLVVAIAFAGIGGTAAFAMSNAINDAKVLWYETYRFMIAAEEVYVNGQLINGFPAFYTRSVAVGSIFEENIYVPLRAVAERLGLKVTWDSKTGSATIEGIQVKQGESTNGYVGSPPQIFGGYLYVSPNFFTEYLDKELDLTYKGVVTAPFGQDLEMTFTGTDKWEDFTNTDAQKPSIRYETIQIGYQWHNIDLEEDLEAGIKWECVVNENTGIIFKDEYLDSEEGVSDKKVTHRFTCIVPRDYAPKATDEVVFTFEQTVDGKKTGNKIIYTAMVQATGPIAKP